MTGIGFRPAVLVPEKLRGRLAPPPLRREPRRNPMTSEPYAEPRNITSLDDCYFYHSMDLPGYGAVSGEWDLRTGLDAYLGNYDFAGKRVLDVGAASGILSFHAESRGAEVVSFDLSEEYSWDIVPFANGNFAPT